MPLTGRDLAVLAILVCCVPFQNWLVMKNSSSSEQRMANLNLLLKEFHTLTHKWFNTKNWIKWAYEKVKYLIKDGKFMFNMFFLFYFTEFKHIIAI